MTAIAVATRSVDVLMGGVFASAEPCVMRTVLGSCVSVCLQDPIARVGGMNHFLLPGEGNAADCIARFGVQAMELLINAIMASGGDRLRLTAKVFGGGNVLAGLKSPTVGERNSAFAIDFLAAERIPVVAQRVGGEDALQVQYHSDTARVWVRPLQFARVAPAETGFLASLTRMARTPPANNVTWFRRAEKTHP